MKNQYDTNLSNKYTDNREDYATSDDEVFGILEEISLQDKKILDLGCGDGTYTSRLIELGAAKVVGVDISESMIEMARKRNEDGAEYVCADGKHMPFEDGQFDLVFSNFVLHYFDDLEAVLCEAVRVLKPGGHVVAVFNVFETSHIELEGTEIPLCLAGKIIVQNTIRSHDNFKTAFSAAGMKLLKYNEVDSSYLSIGDGYKHADLIDRPVNVLCVAQK